MARVRRRLALISCLGVLLVLVACSGSFSSSTATVTVSVTPPAGAIESARAAAADAGGDVAPAAGSSPGSTAAGIATDRSVSSGIRDELLLILDASGSMRRLHPDGRTAMAIAQERMIAAVDALPEQTAVGLRVFGSRVDGHNKPTPSACADTHLVLPITPLEPHALKDVITGTRALGETPIARSLRAGAADFRGDGARTILLVSDGEESCEPDPCATVRSLDREGIDLKIDTIGFGVNPRARSQLTCIAEAGGGTYYDAANGSDLGAALAQALQNFGKRPSGAGAGMSTNGAVGVQSVLPGASATSAANGTTLGVSSGLALAIFVLLIWFFVPKK